MLIDPDTETGRQWIADNAADMGGDVERLLHDHTQVCEVCGNRFTDDDMDDGICWECHGEARSFDPVREFGTYRACNGSVVG